MQSTRALIGSAALAFSALGAGCGGPDYIAPGGVFKELHELFPNGVQNANQDTKSGLSAKAMQLSLDALSSAVKDADKPDAATCGALQTAFNASVLAIQPTITFGKLSPFGVQASLGPTYAALIDIKGPDGKTLEQGYGALKAKIANKCPNAALS